MLRGEGWSDEVGYLSGVAFETSGGVVEPQSHFPFSPEHSLLPVPFAHKIRITSRAPRLAVAPLPEVRGGSDS